MGNCKDYIKTLSCCQDMSISVDLVFFHMWHACFYVSVKLCALWFLYTLNIFCISVSCFLRTFAALPCAQSVVVRWPLCGLTVHYGSANSAFHPSWVGKKHRTMATCSCLSAGQSPCVQAWAAACTECQPCLWHTALLRWNMWLLMVYKWTLAFTFAHNT